MSLYQTAQCEHLKSQTCHSSGYEDYKEEAVKHAGVKTHFYFCSVD